MPLTQAPINYYQDIYEETGRYSHLVVYVCQPDCCTAGVTEAKN